LDPVAVQSVGSTQLTLDMLMAGTEEVVHVPLLKMLEVPLPTAVQSFGVGQSIDAKGPLPLITCAVPHAPSESSTT
jgi:hypothetical protein